MKVTKLQIGDVVQISPELGNLFSGCFMMVTEPKGWGAQGFIAVPQQGDKLPGRAYFRCRFKDMELVGEATWVPADEQEESRVDSE